MKKEAVVILAGAVVFGMAAVALAGPLNRREARQQTRISQGIRIGEIDPGEYRGLQQDQMGIEEVRRYAWSDGKLMPWEVGRLTREQNRADRHIQAAKNNLF